MLREELKAIDKYGIATKSRAWLEQQVNCTEDCWGS